MFDDDVPVVRPRTLRAARSPAPAEQGVRSQILADLRRRLATGASGGSMATPAPISSPSPTESGTVLPVPEPLAAVLPQGGLSRGSVVSLLGDTGVTSLLLTLLTVPQPAWVAVVGMPGIGLAAAAEMGVDLDRLVVIPDPGPDALQVVSVLTDGVDLIAVAAPSASQTTPARLRVLTGRLRQRGAVLLVVGRWPGADLVLTARPASWTGLESGHGRLRDRELIVDVGGRRAAGGGRSAALLLQGNRSGVRVLAGSATSGESGLTGEGARAPAAAGSDRTLEPALVADVG